MVSLDEAQALLREGFTYLDVRSEAEFEDGHARGAVNVPWQRMTASGMDPRPDPEFLARVAERFDRNAKLLVGCRSHNRSLAAAAALEADGYTHLAILRVGFEGIRDHFGTVVELGWGRAGLPIERGD